MEIVWICFAILFTFSTFALRHEEELPGCDDFMKQHFQSARDEAKDILQSLVELERTKGRLVGPFGAARLDDIRTNYLGQLVSHDEIFVRQMFANMPSAMEGTTFSCINATHDPWNQYDRCRSNIALSQPERNQVILCPVFADAPLLRHQDIVGSNVLQLNEENGNLAAHVLLHELAHTSLVSGSRRVVDWFLTPLLAGSRHGHLGQGAVHTQELACMSSSHAVQSADNLAWFALTAVLVLRGALPIPLDEWRCTAARSRFDMTAESEKLIIAT